MANGPLMVFPNSFRYVFPTAPDREIKLYGPPFIRPSWHEYAKDNWYPPDTSEDIDAIQDSTDQESLVEAADKVISWIIHESTLVESS